MFSIPELPVTELSEILLVPGLAVFFGLLVFLLGEFNPALKGGTAWKWLGAIILLLGALAGYRYFNAMVSGSVEANMYRSQLFQRRAVYAHWAAFLLPMACFLGALALSYWRRNRQLPSMTDF